MHCADAVCLIDCPTNAIHRDDDTGTVVIDDATCIGCAACASACPYDNIRMAEANLQFAGDPFVAMGEQAVGHRAVQQGRDDAAVKQPRMSLEDSAAIERRLHTTILGHCEFQLQPGLVIGTAHDTIEMRPVRNPFRYVPNGVRCNEENLRPLVVRIPVPCAAILQSLGTFT